MGSTRSIAASLLAAALLAAARTDAFAFAPRATTATARAGRVALRSEPEPGPSPGRTPPSPGARDDDGDDGGGVHRRIALHDRVVLRAPSPEERGKGGVEVAEAEGVGGDGGGIRALEVLARVPRDLVLSWSWDDAPDRAADAVASARDATWATGLTAAALAAMHPTEEEAAAGGAALRDAGEWVRSWDGGGWGTDATDLGPDIAGSVTGTLLSTGSDNDKNIYAKFRMPCHPALLKASLGLELLTGCDADEAREALTARGTTYRAMRDALQGLVLSPSERKGTLRDRRCWDVADALSRVLSRATEIRSDGGDGAAVAHAVVPVHERLAHSLDANTKLIGMDDEVLLVATRDIAPGEAITRNYAAAPRMANDATSVGSPLHLLLQFGLPPDAWPASA